MYGYIKAENKENLTKRLDRIEGQARGIKRMVQREVYCIDILTQITSLLAASEKVATILIQDHTEQCPDQRLRRTASYSALFVFSSLSLAPPEPDQDCQQAHAR